MGVFAAPIARLAARDNSRNGPSSSTASISAETTGISGQPSITTTSTSSSAVLLPGGPFPTSSAVSASVPKDTSNTEQPSGTASAAPGGDSVSPGAVAGIGIACALVGAAIAAVILICMARRRSPKPHRRDRLTSSRSGRHSFKNGSKLEAKEQPSADQVEFGHGDPNTRELNVNLDSILPQPLADDKIGQEVNGLLTMIDGHVANYYHDQSVVEKSPIPKELVPDAIIAQNRVDVNKMLADPRKRPAAISGIVCAKMLDSINPVGAVERSLLPSVIGLFLRSITAETEASHAYELSLSRWRVSTMFLHGQKAGNDELQHRRLAISSIIGDLDQIVGPYVASETASRRTRDLEMLCDRAAKVGIILVSQPARWGFSWEQPSKTGVRERSSAANTKVSLVMFPSLLRYTDNAARGLRTPLQSLEPRIAH